jgi:transposase
LKEQFGELWPRRTAADARHFFLRRQESLRWQRLEPYQGFARMIAKHWDGIVGYCEPGNQVAIGFVAGLNNKIRTIQKRAYGSRDEECLRHKILTCTLPKL